MYSKFVIAQNKNIYISYWLLLITFLVILMIVVGGITRLTDSGLSITKWDLFAGSIPPLSIEKWNYTFDLYKQIPEFEIQNSLMTLSEFKVIYWWEYAHRLLGRVIGLSYLIPLLFFTIKAKLTMKRILSLYLLFFLICFQGFVGWYMVKSGLTDRIDVSHYRLSVHLTIAFLILIFLIWNFIDFFYPNSKYRAIKLPFNLPLIFIFLIFLQISLGALVSGLDAANIYQTWPLMNQNYFPDDSNIKEIFAFEALSNPSIVQFIHRNLAYFVLLFFLFLSYKVFTNHNLYHLRKIIFFTFICLLFQIVLGIVVLISGANLYISSLHQIGSIILIISTQILIYKNSRVN